MSYILEALKKSERKRPPGPVPDLFTVRGPQPAVRSRRPLLVIAGFTAVAAVAVIGGLVWFGRRRREPALLNAAMLLYVAGKGTSITGNLGAARSALESGQAKAKLAELVAVAGSSAGNAPKVGISA